MNILVTGSEGFIGKHLVNALELNGHTVIRNDITIGMGVKDLNHLTDIDFIFHLAAIPRVGTSRKYPKQTLANNINTTLHLLELARLNPKVKLLNISSSSAKFADTAQNPYALSKLIGEQMAWTYKNTFSVNVSSVRLFNVYGPGEVDTGDTTTLIKACKKAILTNQPLKVTAKGKTSRDFTHVEDVVDGLIKIMKLMFTQNYQSLYELGTDSPTYIGDVVHEFRNLCDMKVEVAPIREGDADTTYAHPKYMVPGWAPKHDVLTYIKQWKDAGCPDD